MALCIHLNLKKMKKTSFILFVVLFISGNCFCQKEVEIPIAVNKFEKNKSYYQQKAEFRIKKWLIKEDKYNVFSVNLLMEKAQYKMIPMFKVHFIDSIDYTRVNNLLNNLELDNKLLFDAVLLVKNNEFLGQYSCSILGDCNVWLYHQGDSNQKYYDELKKIDILNYDYIFSIKGILHTYWLIKDRNLIVYSFFEHSFYPAQDFLDKFYPSKRLNKNINYK